MFRRKRLVFTFLPLLACLFVLWQMTTRSEDDPLMRRLNKGMAESLLLSENIQSFFPSKELFTANKNARNFKRRRKMRKRSIPSDEIFDKLYRDFLDCMLKSQRSLALFLNDQYQKQFRRDFRRRPSVESPILEPECKADLDLVIVVTTRPGNFLERTSIRYSWGRPGAYINRFLIKQKSFTYKTIFTLGRDQNNVIEDVVSKENSRYRDILRLDYQDTYENLAKKTILTLKWVNEACAPRFVLKTDDDCYVNLHNLSPWLLRLSPYVNYVGKKNDLMPVIRDPTHRNYVPFDLFSEEYYKVYCSGGGYILRGTVLGNITSKAKEIPEIINEDAYLGMITNALDIIPYDDERFLPFIFGDINLRKRHMCDWGDKFLMHGASPRRQLLMHWQKLAMVKYSVLCDL
ncbi:beta-1,3-galactosyltransferase 5-like [Clytia hemisphaerica]|uniref:Hexosyltransferase n=1 Tax=Clytia hemisphaerica TaxID=252671 RepID=A0A7M5ULL0_9CNID|eukprot:TCONS_00007921-protein